MTLTPKGIGVPPAALIIPCTPGSTPIGTLTGSVPKFPVPGIPDCGGVPGTGIDAAAYCAVICVNGVVSAGGGGGGATGWNGVESVTPPCD